MTKNALVTTDWLASAQTDPMLRLVDASFFPPNILRNPQQEFAEQHISGAQFFDIDGIVDDSTTLPHMLPTPEVFARKMDALGIGNEHTVVVYDSQGIFSAPRAWWMLRTMGHEKVFVLDGGLPKWLAEGRAVTQNLTRPANAQFTPQFDPALVRTMAQVAARQLHEQLVDARPAGRFSGDEPEIWPGRRMGHIPGACNAFFGSLIDPTHKTLLPPEHLAEKLTHLDLARPITVTCGSGVTACILALALYQLGREDVAVYDGAWAEWGLPESGQSVEVGALSKDQSAL